MPTIAEIRKIVEELTEGTELFLVDLICSEKNEIQVYIDSPTGVNIDTCSKFSRALDERLDREQEDFELMVSSAGIGYPFLVPGQYRKNTGKKVSVKTKDNTVWEGILLSWSPEELVLECEEKRAVAGSKKKEVAKVTIPLRMEEVKETKNIVSFK